MLLILVSLQDTLCKALTSCGWTWDWGVVTVNCFHDKEIKRIKEKVLKLKYYEVVYSIKCIRQTFKANAHFVANFLLADQSSLHIRRKGGRVKPKMAFFNWLVSILRN